MCKRFESDKIKYRRHQHQRNPKTNLSQRNVSKLSQINEQNKTINAITKTSKENGEKKI